MKPVLNILWSLPLTIIIFIALLAMADGDADNVVAFHTALSWFPKVLGIVILLAGLVSLLKAIVPIEEVKEHKGSIILILLGISLIHWSGVFAFVIYLVADQVITSKSSK